MLLKRLILLLMVALFLFLAIPQISELQLLWRDYHAIARYCALLGSNADKNTLADRIPDDLARQDPEAAQIARFLLKGQSFVDAADDAATGAIRYPLNPFFWARLTESMVCREERYDPEILRRIADKLVTVDPTNADYYVLKAAAVLRLCDDNAVNEAIGLLHQAVECRRFEDSFEIYRLRVMNLARESGLGQFEYRSLGDYATIQWSVRDMWDDLLAVAQTRFNDGRTDEVIAITDTLNDLYFAYGGRYSGPMAFMGGRNPLQTTALLELRDPAISSERQKYDHWLLASAAMSYDLPSRPKSDPKQYLVPIKEIQRKYALAVPLLIHCGRMVFAMAVFLVMIRFLQKARRIPADARVGIGNGFLFAAACGSFFVLSNLNYWLTYNYCCGEHLTYLVAMVQDKSRVEFFAADTPWGFAVGLFVVAIPLILVITIHKGWMCLAGWRLTLTGLWAKLGVSIFLIVMLFWALRGFYQYNELGGGGLSDAVEIFMIVSALSMLAYAWGGSSARRKILSIFLFTVVWSLIAIYLVTPHAWWFPFAGFLFSAVAITLCNPAQDRFWRQFANLFTAPQTTARAVGLLVPAIAVYLILIPLCAPWTIHAMNAEYKYAPPSVKHRRICPPPTQETYQAAFRSLQTGSQQLPRIETLAALEPDDLNTVLKQFHDENWKSFATYMPDMYTIARPGRTNKNNDQPPIEQDDIRSPAEEILLHLLDICPPSSVSAITAAFRNPNEQLVLLKRARLGDRSAKQPLLDVLSSKLDAAARRPDPSDANPQNAENSAETVALIVESLVSVSQPDEAAARLIAFLQKVYSPIPNTAPSFGEEPSPRFHNFFPSTNLRRFAQAVCLLPSPQAANVINVYLDLCESMPPRFQKEYLRDMEEVMAVDFDASIADRILQMDLASIAEADPDDNPEPFDLAAHLGIESIPHLQAALSSRYATYRAWSVWQLRRLGYTFTDQEIARLKTDPEVSVRANLAMAVHPVRLADFASDPSPIVQAVILLRSGGT